MTDTTERQEVDSLRKCLQRQIEEYQRRLTQVQREAGEWQLRAQLAELQIKRNAREMEAIR